MDRRFVRSSECSSPCLPLEPFEHKGKTYPALEIFAYVIDILAVVPKALETKSKSEEEREPKKEGVKGPQATKQDEKEEEEEKEEGQVAHEKEDESNKEKVSANKEKEDPAEQVLKAIRAYIEEIFEEEKPFHGATKQEEKKLGIDRSRAEHTIPLYLGAKPVKQEEKKVETRMGQED
ncbi:hypothetical protein JCGZ_05962 [Jatropha curcas]|uniref:Uncharacterized protein n=1 Tax=Jatropha curcas TaxID=180498 RepID=A0A067KR78_JATCU|nr:hypothetical protein JCGZ_05962 [Jatropha curcas]